MAEQADRKAIVRVLDDVEARLNALKVRYEQYFSQVEKLEPVKERQELDRRLREFSRRRIIQTDLRFRQMTLSSRFYSFCQYWDRIVRRIEEGKFFPEHQSSIPHRSSSGQAEDMQIDAIYEEFVRIRLSCNLTGSPPKKEQFAALVEKQRERIAEKLGSADFDLKLSVVREGGKPHIRFQVRKHT
ncbi:MAG: hypothetical protein GX751_07310 [Desulfuromonadaceae bacterium]|nr:hypothetical protein [Desulfuromonadaceae bacterium]